MLLIVRLFVCSGVCLFLNVVLLTYFDIAQHFIYHSYIIEWKIDESKGFAPWCGNIVDGILLVVLHAEQVAYDYRICSIR